MSTENIEQNTEPTGSACGKSCSLGKTILFGAALLVAVFVALAAMQPDEFRVSRSATMTATPEAVFAQVNDLHHWEAWSPWAKLDPDAETSYEGPSSGTGAVMHWNGDSNIGEGSMTITESQPSELVRLRLDFERPMAGTCDVDFTLQPEGDQTKVTWTMSGKNNFLAKVISLFMDCEEMTGGYFEEGLTSLKSVVEGSPQVN